MLVAISLCAFLSHETPFCIFILFSRLDLSVIELIYHFFFHSYSLSLIFSLSSWLLLCTTRCSWLIVSPVLYPSHNAFSLYTIYSMIRYLFMRIHLMDVPYGCIIDRMIEINWGLLINGQNASDGLVNSWHSEVAGLWFSPNQRTISGGLFVLSENNALDTSVATGAHIRFKYLVCTLSL